MEEGSSLVFKNYANLPRRKMSYENVEPLGFGTLPIAILVNIFSYIDRHELLKHTSLVCRHWRHAVKQPEFMKSLCITGNAIPLSFIFDHLRRFRLLEGLHIDNVNKPLVILMQASKLLVQLKRLSLTNYDSLDISLLKYVMRTFPNLEMLNLDRTQLDGLKPVYSLIVGFRNLKSLNLTKIQNLSMKNILETILNCRKLEEINMSLLPATIDLKDEDAILIIGNIGPNLKSISLDSRSLTSRTYEKLCDCPNLEKLFLHYSLNLNYEMLQNLTKHLPNIKEFGFTHNFIITGQNIEDIFTERDYFKNLIVIDFSSCILIGDDGIVVVAKICKHLKVAKLRCCRALTNIDILCKKCRKLQYLDVSFCDTLQPTFSLKGNLEKLVIHESEVMLDFIQKPHYNKYLRIYLALSEYTDEIVRLY